MTPKRYSPAGHVLRFIERVEQQFQGKNRAFIECVASAFDASPWDFRCAEIQYTQLRHIEAASRFVDRSEETDDAKRVYSQALRRIGDSIGPKHSSQGWQDIKTAIDRDRAHLVLLDSRMLSATGGVAFDTNQIDELERRLQSALSDFEAVGADDGLLSRFRDLVSALLFGLRNIDVLGPDVAWERASSLVTEVAAVAEDLSVASQRARPLRMLVAAGAAALGLLHAARVATDDTAAIMSNLREIGAHAIEWQERPMIEDKRADKTA